MKAPVMKLISHFRLFLVFFLLILFPAQAQIPHYRKHVLPHEYEHASINTILQDKSRFIWLGTSAGLFRFNSFHYEHYDQERGEEKAVTALFEDSKGQVWVGYKNGLIARIESDSMQFPEPVQKLPKVSVTGFAEDTSGSLWTATYGEGLYIESKGTIYTINEEDGLADNYVYSIIADKKGNVWIGTDGGMMKCSFKEGTKQVQIIDASHGLPDNIVTAIAADEASGALWIGTESMGICRYDPDSEKFYAPNMDWEYGRVNQIRILQEDIWIGTAKYGILEADISGKRLYQVSRLEKDVSSAISCLTNDKEGNIWIANGTKQFFFVNRTFSFLSEIDGKPIDNVHAVLHAKNGIIWYSTGKKVFSFCQNYRGKEGKKDFQERIEFNGKNVISLYQDFTGNIWLGTFDNGLYIFNPARGKLKQITEKDGLINNNILSFAGDGHDVWLATLGGVSRCRISGKTDPGKSVVDIKNYSYENGLGSNYIYKVFVDSKKRIWFATDGKGVTLLDNGTFRNFTQEQGLKSKVVYSITEDTSGGIWVSTSDSKLYKFNGKGFTSCSPKGLTDLTISSVIGDKRGNILLVDKQGIAILNVKSETVVYHRQEAGISDIDPHLNAYYNDPEGNIWIGTQSGIIRYRRTEGQMESWPYTRINKVLLYLNQVSANKKQEFDHDQNHISFDYAGFWYHNPADVNYQIKLEGYDREWINSKNQFVTYPSLPPGHYTFKVKSSATSDFDGAEVKTYSFSIIPPFYNSLWFYFLCFFSGSGLLFFVVKRREHKFKMAERQKKKQIEFQFNTLKSQVNPHFLFNSFNTLIAVIEDDQKTAVEYVEKLSDFYRTILLHRESDVIPLREELDMINNYYFLQVKRYKNNFILKIKVPEVYLDMQIPPLTLQLLLENAVKHNVIARDKPLIVELYEEDGYLIVRNNVQRKHQHEPSTGFGLNNIGNRFKLLTDKAVKIEELPDQFLVKIPLLPKLP